MARDLSRFCGILFFFACFTHGWSTVDGIDVDKYVYRNSSFVDGYWPFGNIQFRAIVCSDISIASCKDHHKSFTQQDS